MLPFSFAILCRLCLCLFLFLVVCWKSATVGWDSGEAWRGVVMLRRGGRRRRRREGGRVDLKEKEETLMTCWRRGINESVCNRKEVKGRVAEEEREDCSRGKRKERWIPKRKEPGFVSKRDGLRWSWVDFVKSKLMRCKMQSAKYRRKDAKMQMNCNCRESTVEKQTVLQRYASFLAETRQKEGAVLQLCTRSLLPHASDVGTTE